MAQLILQPGAATGKDAYIADGGFADINHGDNSEGFAGTYAVGKTWEFYRSLFEYDFSAIPPGSTIGSATFELTKTGSTIDSGSLALSLRRLTEAWTELGVTWNREDGTLFWTTPGASHNNDDHTLTDKVDISYTNGALISLPATALVQEGLDNQAGIGSWLLIGEEHDHGAGPSDLVSFYLCEWATAAQRPKLTINYTPPDTFDLDLYAATTRGLDFHTATARALDARAATTRDLDFHAATTRDLDFHAATTRGLDFQLYAGHPAHVLRPRRRLILPAHHALAG